MVMPEEKSGDYHGHWTRNVQNVMANGAFQVEGK